MQFVAKLLCFLFLLSPLLPTTTKAGTPPQGSIDVPNLVEKVDKGVVNIQAVTFIRESYVDPYFEDFFNSYYGIPKERVRKQPSLGSGVVIDESGYIITNHHVIDRASEIEIFFDDGKRTRLKAQVIGMDKKTDLALLKVKNGPHLLPLKLGNSDSVRVGESVVAIGNPFGLNHTVTAGIISAKNRVIGQGPYDNYLQTDASINPGNSGGPLFNSSGEVIGINTAINAAGQNLGFAIPINQVKRVLADLKEHGRVLRGWLGALVVTTPHGVFIDGIVLKSAAMKNGLLGGDRIVKLNDTDIEERIDMERALESKRPGDVITLVVERSGRFKTKTQTYKITLGEEPPVQQIPPGLL